MRKLFITGIAILCVLAATGCGREASEPSDPAKTPTPAPEVSAPSGETPSPDTAPTVSADTGAPDAQTSPATVAAYLSVAEALWKSNQEHVDYRMAFGSTLLDQRQAVDLQKDYHGEIILADDFAETGKFTLSLSVDGTADNLYVLEGDRTHTSIAFGSIHRLGSTLYMGTGVSEEPFFALDPETKTLTDFKKEYETLQKLYDDFQQGQPEPADLRIQYLQPMAQIGDCLICLATISEAMDTDTRAAIYAAFDSSHSLKAYLLLTEADYLPPAGLK